MRLRLFLPFKLPVYFGVIRCTCLKMAYNSKMSDHRAKRSEIWDLGTLLTYVTYLWPCSIQCHLGVICTCLTMARNSKTLVSEQMAVKFGTRGQWQHMYVPLSFLFSCSIMRSFAALVSKLVWWEHLCNAFNSPNLLLSSTSVKVQGPLVDITFGITFSLTHLRK